MSTTSPLKLVTIVTEPVLQVRLVRDLQRFGASGHTVTDVMGEGSRGMRASEFPGKNIKVETVVSDQVAELILNELSAHYFPHYACVAWVTTVEVVRGEKYGGGLGNEGGRKEG